MAEDAQRRALLGLEFYLPTNPIHPIESNHTILSTMKFLLLATALATAVFAKVPEWHAHYRMNTAEYQSTFDHYLSQGFKVNSVSGYQRDGEANYAAIFEKNEAGVAWWSHTRMTAAAYQQKFDKYVADGYRLRQVNGYNVGVETYYAAIWDKTASGPWVARHGMDEAGLKKYFEQYVNKEGYRLVHASGYEVKGEARYAAIWEKTGDEDVAWDADLQANRERCKEACKKFNEAGPVSRRRRVELWRDIVCDTRPMPPVNPDPAADEKLFEKTDPVVDPPISVDHGLNFKVGAGTFINFDTTVLDTCLITIGERVLFGPHIRIYGATHPMDPAERRGLEGPEAGKEIHIEDDVWIGGSAIILAGVRIGRGSTVGAGSVVTKDVPPFHFVAGNPARVIRKIESSMEAEQ